MEFEAVDEGVIVSIDVAEGTDEVKVGTVIAQLAGEGEDASAKPAAAAPATAPAPAAAPAAAAPAAAPAPASAPAAKGDRVSASPLARRIAEQKGLDLSAVAGSGPNGRIVKADVEGAKPAAAAPAAAAPAPAAAAPVAAPAPAAPAALPDFGIPHEDQPLSGMRKTIARRLTESKQQVPHIYLSLDVRLDALLKLRGEVNASLSGRGVKVSVNDMLIKALGVALEQVPVCNVAFAGDTIRQYKRADVSVAVSIPNGLITPIIQDAGSKGLAKISAEMADLGKRAKEGKLAPTEYVGGTASLSNMGMMGIKNFQAIINPPQAMILAVGAGEKRPWVLEDGSLGVATAMTITGSFDHRAIDGSDGAKLMAAIRALVENPLALLA